MASSLLLNFRTRVRGLYYASLATQSGGGVTGSRTDAVDLDDGVAGDVREHRQEDIWNGNLRELRELHQKPRFHELATIYQESRDSQSARAGYYSL